MIEQCCRSAEGAGGDGDSLYTVALTLNGLGAAWMAMDHVSHAVEVMRQEGRLRELTHLCVIRGYAAFRLGRWELAESDAGDAAQLAEETSQPMWVSVAQSLTAALLGVRGHTEAAERLLVDAEREGQSAQAATALFFSQTARALVCASAGQHADAYWHLQRACDPDAPDYHPFWSARVMGELADAALAIGKRDDARDVLSRLDESLADSPLGYGRLGIRHAHAVLADEDEADHLFRVALEAEPKQWMFDRARLQLAFGAWLRRSRRAADSRVLLRAALKTFGLLQATPWEERARQELRASGERSSSRAPQTRETLSPQEIEVARLAAAGLSNREIGQRLNLSHRTVGSHLYRIFPKLGVISRRELQTLELERDDSIPSAAEDPTVRLE